MDSKRNRGIEDYGFTVSDVMTHGGIEMCMLSLFLFLLLWYQKRHFIDNIKIINCMSYNMLVRLRAKNFCFMFFLSIFNCQAPNFVRKGRHTSSVVLV